MPRIELLNRPDHPRIARHLGMSFLMSRLNLGQRLTSGIAVTNLRRMSDSECERGIRRAAALKGHSAFTCFSKRGISSPCLPIRLSTDGGTGPAVLKPLRRRCGGLCAYALSGSAAPAAGEGKHMLSVLGVIFAGFLGYNRAPLWTPFVTAIVVLGVAVIDATSAIAPWHTDLPIASLPPSAFPLVAFAVNIVLMYLVFGVGWAVARLWNGR